MRGFVTVTEADRLRPYARLARRDSALAKEVREASALMKEIEEQLRASLTDGEASLIQLDSIARRARETEDGFGRIHGAGIIQQDRVRGGYTLSGWPRTARRLSCSEPTIRSCGKTLERGRPDLPELRSVRQKLALNQSALHMTGSNC